MDDEALQTCKRRVTERYPDSAVYLFGSRARDEHIKRERLRHPVIAISFTEQTLCDDEKNLCEHWMATVTQTSSPTQRMNSPNNQRR